MSSKRSSGSFKGRINTVIPGSTQKIACGSSVQAASPTVTWIKSEDSSIMLPKFTAALNRGRNEHLPAEDLDAIQLELEQLLFNASQRSRLLMTEYDVVEKEDRRERKNKSADKSPASPGKRKRTEDRKNKDRFTISVKISKQRGNLINSPSQYNQIDDSHDALQSTSHRGQKDQLKPLTTKNDIPNKFWLSIEPYSMPITNEDMKLLDDLLGQYSGPLVPPIAELGPHYSQLWSTDEFKEEREFSSNNIPSRLRHLPIKHDVNEMMQKADNVIGEGITGPLSQRFVSILLEENLIPDDVPTVNVNTSKTDNASLHLKSISLLENGINLEKQLRKELCEQEIIDSCDEDEILSEIKRVLAELSNIAEYNCMEIKKLNAISKNEMKRLEIKRELDIVDQEIIEMYKKVLISKQKRRQITAQEKDAINQLAQEQKRLSDLLENAGSAETIFT